MANVDLTAITTPMFLLDEATRTALKAHGGPYELCWDDGWIDATTPSWHSAFTYRVKPGPKRQTVKCCFYHGCTPYHFTIDLIDREPDWSSLKPVSDP